MKSILVLGLGRYGRHITIKLNALGHQVMAVDRDEHKVDEVIPYVKRGQIGDCTDEEFLRSLGVRNFDVCIISIGNNFQAAMETTATLKELGAPYVVARAGREVHEKFLRMAGADDIIYPEKQQAIWTAIRYSSDHMLDYMQLDDDYAIYEVDVPEKWVGKTIGDLDIRKKYSINIISIKVMGEMQMNISAEYLLKKDDTMLIIGNEADIHKCLHL